MEMLESTRTSMTEISALLEELARVQTSMDSSRAGQSAAAASEPEPEPEPVATAELGDDLAVSSLVGDEFAVGGAAVADSIPFGAEAIQDGSSESSDDEAEADVWDVDMDGFSPADESAEVEAMPGAESSEEQRDHDVMATGMVDAQSDLDLPPAIDDELDAPPGEGTRLVVTSPGAEPVVYPFNGEVMSLGRGRNNDVQIKNDGKISRYHCRIFRRGDEYVVEDNKSSNGTLVNGKLVTRQRLDGGEQVQVGETRVLFCAL